MFAYVSVLFTQNHSIQMVIKCGINDFRFSFELQGTYANIIMKMLRGSLLAETSILLTYLLFGWYVLPESRKHENVFQVTLNLEHEY